MALVVTMNVGYTSVHADPASDKTKIQQVQTQRDGLENQVEVMDNQIQTIMIDINGNNSNISETQKSIKQSQIDIAKEEVAIKIEQGLFEQRMRVMYMNGSTSYIEIILDSKNIGDFISNLEDLKKIIYFDTSVINEFKSKETAINLKKATLDIENTRLISLKVENENKLADLNKQKSVQAVLVEQLNAEVSHDGIQLRIDQASVLASQVAMAKLRYAVAQNLKNSTPNSTNSAPRLIESSYGSRKEIVAPSVRNPTNTSENYAPTSSANSAPSVTVGSGVSVSSDAILAYASNFLGIPYVWGGTSPSGFDCSGFTQYVFAHFGINLPRVAAAQQNVGTFESRADLQPGDLVFFGNPAYHVGIYVGNGNMICSPCTGQVLQIQPLDNDFSYGRKVN